MTTEFHSSVGSRRRQVRGWCVLVLLGFALLGGVRTASRVAEEASSTETSEVVEFAHRLAEGGQRSLNRRGPPRFDRLSAVRRTAESRLVSIMSSDALGAVSSGRHELSNGLSAPQRC